jgi:Holliday junction resolvasome RuvABC DNA-binding subunit
MWIGGTATNLVVHRIDEQPVANVNGAVDTRAQAGVAQRRAAVAEPPSQATAPRTDDTNTRSTAWLALKSLGWKTSIDEAAVDAALAELGPEPALDPLIRAALQRCR